MKGTISLTTLDVEVLTPVITGPGNYAPYINLAALAAGDEVEVKQYLDVEGESDLQQVASATVTYQDVVDSGDAGFFGNPFVLEAAQTAVVGVTIVAQTTALPRSIGWRVTNIGTGA